MTFLCLLLAAAALAEPGDDAVPILERIAAAARTVKSWRVEGLTTVEVRQAGGARSGAPLREAFRGAAQGANLRLEDRCDGASCLTAAGSNLIWPHAAWPGLTEGVESAVIAGVQRMQYQGAETLCEVVKAEYSSPPVVINIPPDLTALPGAPCTRILCVDRKRRLILRDQVTARVRDDLEVTVAVDFSRLERDPHLPANYFAVAPPAPVMNDANRPALPLSRIAAEYTEEAREARIQGVVKLSLEVDAGGRPQNVRVTQPLDPGLDERAVAAVETWRFEPALKDGKPVASQTEAEVHFQLVQEDASSSVLRLPAPPPARRDAASRPQPEPEPVPETLLDGYVTALFVRGDEARTQRFRIGDPLQAIRGFLANGALYESEDPALEPAVEVDPEWREVYCGVVRLAVNAGIKRGQPFPAPRKLAVLVDDEDRARAFALE